MNKKEIINIKTNNGTALVERTATKATITVVRSCYGFKETSKTVVEKLTEDCIHFAFSPTNDLIETLKSE